METHKHNLLEKLHAQIRLIQDRIAESMAVIKTTATKSLREIGSMQPADQVVYMQLKGYAVDRMEQLEHLHKSPFFTKCEIIDTDTQEKKSVFFATHQYIEESIYSWTSPVASIRFESLGDISYKLPNGEYKKITILQREQYMIVDGKVIFYAQENPGTPRELIYQEHFTKQKSEFILPEIVAQMEKAQDAVIRADHRGPLVISGPAGSGKTTLALHRVAYLTQAPDTASIYSPESIIVFVQDSGTKEYFSHLLPGLGIHNVNITTFPEWAMKILGLSGYEYTHREGDTEQEKDLIEYKKINALRSERPFTIPKNAKVLDRLDLTILLKEYLKKHARFETVRQFDAVVKGVIRKKRVKKSIEYSLLVVDEFQNYLPEQLSILKQCLRVDTQSVVYVGDMGQQVYLGTIKKWEQIGEVVLTERNIRLDKVYRNTKNILQFIQKLGYDIRIPEGIKEGPAVVEKIFETAAEEIAYIKRIMTSYREGSIGVIAKDEEYLRAFKNELENDSHVHVLTMKESQGVEFDLVCIVGVDQEMFSVSEHIGVSAEHIEERKQIQKDILYVALTRAITELHVMGRVSLARVKM